MLKGHKRFNSVNGKSLVLIVDDEQMNRELLGFIVQDTYDVIYASNGEEALAVMRENSQVLALVLLDLLMPVMDGITVLKRMRDIEEISRIPVIVMTSEAGSEVECLKLGATDFITKPFPKQEVILARMQRTIELYEDRNILQSTERDEMTGLFNKEFFFNYSEQYDRFHPDQVMDAVVLNINHFHVINEMYGRPFGDDILIHMAGYLKELIEETGCIACRMDSDIFLVYIKNGRKKYEELSKEINSYLEAFNDINVRVRCGVYQEVDKAIEIERRFDRAQAAVNHHKGKYVQMVTFYDQSIHEQEMFEDRLLHEFENALAEGQFEVYFQPKYDVSGDEPVLCSAEALVRWRHPVLGMVSPGAFIPLFERNGLIHQLDRYIWRRVVEMMRVWKETAGIDLPISVNISRVDLYNDGLVDDMTQILDENGIDISRLYLEITESSYAEDTDQIMDMVERLRNRGFCIEMDDFGTGYSSLNMLAEVNVDILKLDMRFVQHLRSNEKQETLIRLIMEIATHLSMRVVAEGVEEKSQVDFLRSVGCFIIQGYYFSKPLPEEDFVRLASGR